MTVKIYCDVCGTLIPEASSGEGEDAGQLLVGWGPWGERLKDDWRAFDFDALCENCYKAIKDAIAKIIDQKRKREEA